MQLEFIKFTVAPCSTNRDPISCKIVCSFCLCSCCSAVSAHFNVTDILHIIYRQRTGNVLGTPKTFPSLKRVHD